MLYLRQCVYIACAYSCLHNISDLREAEKMQNGKKHKQPAGSPDVLFQETHLAYHFTPASIHSINPISWSTDLGTMPKQFLQQILSLSPPHAFGVSSTLVSASKEMKWDRDNSFPDLSWLVIILIPMLNSRSWYAKRAVPINCSLRGSELMSLTMWTSSITFKRFKTVNAENFLSLIFCKNLFLVRIDVLMCIQTWNGHWH